MVELVVRGDTGVVLLTLDAARHADLAASVATLLGAPLPQAGVVARGGCEIVWQGPRDWLLLPPRDDTAGLAAALEKILAGRAAIAADRSDGHVVFDLAGEDAADVLARGTAVALDRPGATATRLGPLRVILISRATGFTLIVERHYAAWLSLWLREP